jgi:hypothetical protein
MAMPSGIPDILGKKELKVVIVDTSLTVKSFKPVERTWPGIVSSSGPGTRVVLGLMMGEVDGHLEFRLIRDVTLPTFEILKSRGENTKVWNRTVDYLNGGIAEGLAQPRSNRTEILRTIVEVARYFASMPNADKECTFISDMLEDDGQVAFEKAGPTATSVHALIAHQRSERKLPDLRGVKFRAAGVTAPTRQIEDSVRSYWHEYLTSCGATVVDYGYDLTRADATALTGSGAWPGVPTATKVSRPGK